MKNYFIGLIVLPLMVLTSCQHPAVVENSASADYAAFDKKVEVLRSFIKAHCEENLTDQIGFLADTLKWSPPYYNGNEWLGKEEFAAALQEYHANFDNITFNEGIPMGDTVEKGMWSGSVFPKEDATNDPDVIRLYGTWTATHTESGKKVGVKWFALAFLNDGNKIVRFTEYFDVNGLAAQIASEE